MLTIQILGQAMMNLATFRIATPQSPKATYTQARLSLQLVQIHSVRINLLTYH